MSEALSRRPVTSRDKNWAKASASHLAKSGVKPNTISIASAGFAAIAAAFLVASANASALASPNLRALFLAGVVLGILGRLICNLLDGMVAVEGGMKTRSGEVFNDFPDRVSDILIFVAMGYAASIDSSAWMQAGWAAALIAVLTAYLRYLGAGCGIGQCFNGPMAKQHRMAVSIAASFLAMVAEPRSFPAGSAYRLALMIVIAGGVLTCANRTRKIVRALESRP